MRGLRRPGASHTPQRNRSAIAPGKRPTPPAVCDAPHPRGWARDSPHDAPLLPERTSTRLDTHHTHTAHRDARRLACPTARRNVRIGRLRVLARAPFALCIGSPNGSSHLPAGHPPRHPNLTAPCQRHPDSRIASKAGTGHEYGAVPVKPAVNLGEPVSHPRITLVEPGNQFAQRGGRQLKVRVPLERSTKSCDTCTVIMRKAPPPTGFWAGPPSPGGIKRSPRGPK